MADIFECDEFRSGNILVSDVEVSTKIIAGADTMLVTRNSSVFEDGGGRKR